MKILVTGATGQLGFDILKELKRRNHIAVGVSSKEMDITNFNEAKDIIKKVNPQAIIHCAAYTAVDNAEEDIEKCRKVNAYGTENIAKICKELDIKMMYYSTDYVFSGEGKDYWKPDDKIKEPLNIYGKTKYEGEITVQKYLDKFYIIRISWVFGINGNNFVKTMLKLGKERDVVCVVNDQIGSPTYTYDLAKLSVDMIESDKYGIYHAANEGICSWYEFAKEIFRQSNIDVKLKGIKSCEFPTKARRPKNSRMSKDKLVENGFNRLPSWQNALSRYLKEIED